MKKNSLLLSFIVAISCTAKAQNADMLYSNAIPNVSGSNYSAASFVIDVSLPAYPYQRGMLLWAANTISGNSGSHAFTLDETLANGVPVTQHRVTHPNTTISNFQPKKILRSRFFKGYYVLAMVTNSTNFTGGFTLFNTPVLIKLDDNLTAIWARRVHLSGLTSAKSAARMDYNDIIETSDGNVAMVGRYAASGAANAQQQIQFAKIDATLATVIWANYYQSWSCHSYGLSLVEAPNGDLIACGYAEKCALPSLSGIRQLLFAKVSSAGAPVLFRQFDNPIGNFVGDKITRFSTVAATNGRYFISGYIEVPSGSAIPNRQNLLLDINGLGAVSSAAHFGAAQAEEVFDHIFSKSPVGGTLDVYLTGYTNSISPQTQAYFSTIRYNPGTFVYTILRYDVFKNYAGYAARFGLEVKNAGISRFAILTGSIVSAAPAGTVLASTVFVRDLTKPASDTLCYVPRIPELVTTNWHFKDTVPPRKDGYRTYDELWLTTEKIPNRLVCGPEWIIKPKDAVNAFVNPPDEISPQEPGITTARAATPLLSSGEAIYPNPAGTEVNLLLEKVSGKQGIPVRINLYTPAMKLIRSQQAVSQRVQRISLEGLLPGMYLVQVQQGTAVRLYRFVKQ